MSGRTIYHMVPQTEWQQQAPETPYRPASLAGEGFIHCTGEADRLVNVANMFYSQVRDDFVILCLDTDAIRAEIRWEEADGHRFPHIYGPLNLDAVSAVVPFPRDASGTFLDPGL